MQRERERERGREREREREREIHATHKSSSSLYPIRTTAPKCTLKHTYLTRYSSRHSRPEQVGYPPNAGIVPMAFEQLFQRIEANDDPGITYEVTFSMLEVYVVSSLFIFFVVFFCFYPSAPSPRPPAAASARYDKPALATALGPVFTFEVRSHFPPHRRDHFIFLK